MWQLFAKSAAVVPSDPRYVTFYKAMVLLSPSRGRVYPFVCLFYEWAGPLIYFY
jgi:hypothetical protein